MFGRSSDRVELDNCFRIIIFSTDYNALKTYTEKKNNFICTSQDIKSALSFIYSFTSVD